MYNTKNSQDLFKAILSLKNEDECKRFLRDLLTEAEIKEFANRWRVARMLDKKIAYKIIEKQTGMSSTTIARTNKWVQDGMGGYTFMLKRFNTMKNKTKTNKANHHTSPQAV